MLSNILENKYFLFSFIEPNKPNMHFVKLLRIHKAHDPDPEEHLWKQSSCKFLSHWRLLSQMHVPK